MLKGPGLGKGPTIGTHIIPSQCAQSLSRSPSPISSKTAQHRSNKCNTDGDGYRYEKSKSSLTTIGIETGIKIDQLIVIIMALVMLNTIRIMSPIQRERTNTKMSKRKPKVSTGCILMVHIHIETRTLIVISMQRRKASTKGLIIPMVMIIMIKKGTETTIQIQIKITRNWT